MTGIDKVQAIFAGAGSQVVGAVVMWSLSGVDVPRAELRERMTAIGLGAAVPKDPRPETVLAKAVRQAVGTGKAVFPRRLAKRAFALVEEVEVHDVLDHHHTLTVQAGDGATVQVERVNDKRPEAPEPSPMAEEIAQAVAREAEHVLTHAGTEDLSQVLVAAMQGTDKVPGLGAVSLRQGTGGVYFVPGPMVQTTRQLKALVDGLGASHVTVLTLYGDVGNLDEAASAARASFTAKLNDLRGELKDFVNTMREGKKEMTDKHVATRVARLDVLKSRVDMWTGALGDTQAELQAQIAAAKEAVAREMGLA